MQAKVRETKVLKRFYNPLITLPKELLPAPSLFTLWIKFLHFI